jgi:glycosyltransferase involved in cell wall biosynthesis
MSTQLFKGVRVVGPLLDGSGYAEASRLLVKSLYEKEVPLCTKIVYFDRDLPDLGDDGELMEGLTHSQIPYDINIVRLTPDMGVRFIESDKTNILNFAWETSKIPSVWVDLINRFDGIIVETKWVKEVCEDSGVGKPVFVVPNSIDTSPYTLKEKPKPMEETYLFYSIHQWIHRKNTVGLLKAYYRAFDSTDRVRLVLKTYLHRYEAGADQTTQIKQYIDVTKKSLQFQKELPPVYLITEKLSNEALIQLHNDSDCYILLDRGEGFGLPFAEAAAAGNAIIGTDFGGTRDFLNEDNSYCVSWQPGIVSDMMWSPYYTGDMTWAEPNLIHAAELMRRAYEEREESFNKGMKARKTIEELLNMDRVAAKFMQAVQGILERKK